MLLEDDIGESSPITENIGMHVETKIYTTMDCKWKEMHIYLA